MNLFHKSRRFVATYGIALLVLTGSDHSAFALEGTIGVHDPSTIAVCDGKYYVYGTGRGVSVLMSTNLWNWERGERVFERIPESVSQYVPKNRGSGIWAPDIIKVDERWD